jgi:hypothetical protein
MELETRGGGRNRLRIFSLGEALLLDFGDFMVFLFFLSLSMAAITGYPEECRVSM